MKLFLSIFFSVSVLCSFGQSKWVKKSEKLYLKGNYEKCISKTKKYMLKERRSADLQYFIVQSNLALSKQQQGTRRISYLRKTISSWEKLERYNKDHKDYSLLEKELLESLNSELLAMDIGSRKGDYFHNKLAEVFGDTSQRYRDIHQIKIVAKEVEVVIPLDTRFKDLSEERMEIIKAAKNAVGVTYKYGGSDSTGFDCSGFTQYVYQSAGIELPHNANMQSKMGDTIDIREAQPGDLIFFGSNNRAFHAGLIYANKNGEIELVHCASRGVTYQKSDDENTKYWLKRVLRVQQIVPNAKADEEK